MAYSCSRPFYDVLVSAVSNPANLWDWAFCPYTITGLGLTGVGLFVLATGFVGLKNWTEGWTLPLTWLALVGPTLAFAMLPGGVIRQVAGVLTIAAAMAVVGIWYWWGRA